IDLSASAVALASLPTGELQGLPFLEEGAPEREFVFMARDRIETSLDHVRMVFDGRYRYIRSFQPDRPHFIERAYYDRTNPVRSLMRRLFAEGQLTPQQAKVFDPRRREEELYDLLIDPYELNNLLTSGLNDAPPPEAEAALFRMRAALDSWIVETGDRGGEAEDPEAVDLGGGSGSKKRRTESRKQKTEGGKQKIENGKRKRRVGVEIAPAVPTAGAAVEPLVLSRMGILFAGGEEVSSRAGGGRRGGGAQSNIIEQAPVHYLIPADRKHEAPVVMLPGHGLTSYIYLSTPDGRDGWAQDFTRQGYAVYVMDQPNYAVSGFDLRPFEAVRSGGAAPETLPGMMRWSNEAAWRDWGIGLEPGQPFEDTKFPYEYLDQLLASYTTVISSGEGGATGGQKGKRSGGVGKGDRFGSAPKTKALTVLLEQIGPAILVVHSAAGAVGTEILQRRPELLKALIMIEPVGCPTDRAGVNALFADVPILVVFGDHFDVRRMQGRYEACLETVRLVEEAGGRSKMLHLPSLGISGNTHLLMLDRNSREIAARVINWLQNNQLD
ncbi:MAG: hypothetical protein ACK2U5_10000, partial [Candidatus Promineifilaceae bacterium]